jgi:hypothetical protein
MTRVRLPAGIRTRLVVGSTLVAVLLGGLAAVALSVSLHRGLASSLDGALLARAQDQIDALPEITDDERVTITPSARDVGAFAIVLRADGTIASA